ncbi:MAG: filamentous hemagglutinin N-terminal domain-containing protein [Syntrophaceae bacterium]|nr:filamentous hemagglutinin N-terminal domain-containing protein [Syntrophaceae bacterium]
MNKVHQHIWLKAKGKWFTFSQKTAHGSGPAAIFGAITLAAFLSFSGTSSALEPGALPTGGKIVSGKGSISTTGSQMTVKQSTDRMIANWNTFNIGTRAGVTFRQPDADSAALNRIYDQNPSQILGSLSANGKIFLINPSGIIFGEGSQVNVGGLVASTLNMADSDFLTGHYTFLNDGNAGSILNLGDITAVDGGIVALIAPIVTNEGTITASGGGVILGAGNQVTLDFNGDGLISYTINKGAIDALAQNKGLIQADGGMVVMTAEAANTLTSAVVNNSGIIEAQTLQNKGGRIILMSDMDSGTTTVGGKLDASAPNGGDGGFIETSGKNVKINDSAVITTAAPMSIAGTWLIDPTNFTIAASGGDITGTLLGTNLSGGNVTIATSAAGTEDGYINVNDNVTWSANTLSLQAHSDININAVLTANNTAALDMRAGYSTPGTDGGTYNETNTVKVGMLPDAGGFRDRVDFFQADSITPRSGTGFLTINGNGYTVITDLGVQGSTTGTDLQGMNGNLSGYYALGSNIDATATLTWNSGSGFAPIGNSGTNFTGTFNGLGHIISNLNINRPTEDCVGLFGFTTRAMISNVGVTDASITGRFSVGSMVGLNDIDSIITNSYATGNVNGDHNVGGLVGGSRGDIYYSYATCSVRGTEYVGGLVGTEFKLSDFDDEGEISNSYATGSVNGDRIVGGLVGNSEGIIINSYATGSVSGNVAVGGLVGLNYFYTITNSYATGSVSGHNDVGGLVGYNLGSITDTYATGSVNGGSEIGGLVGDNRSNITNSFSTGNISGVYSVGGLIGANKGSITNSYSTASVSTDGMYVGGLVGWNSGAISNAYATGSVSGAYVGGLIGWNSGAISNAFATGAVNGVNNVGGLVGDNSVGTITNSYATGSVSGGLCIGGLVGVNRSANITNSYATGSINGKSTWVGGLVGVNYGNITDSYATGSVSGALWVGGLVGGNSGNITDSYATGNVNGGDSVGGLVGFSDYGSINNSYATGNVSGDDRVGGLVGYNYGSSITNSYATGSVNGGSEIGGLVGDNRGDITNSYAIGMVNSDDSGSDYDGCCDPAICWIGYGGVGGLVGWNYYGSINNSYATGKVIGGNGVGGLVGYNQNGEIYDSCATGNVIGKNLVGGLVGIVGDFYTDKKSIISNTYATGSVSGKDWIGGLIGGNVHGNIIDAYATGSVSGRFNIGGLVGSNLGSITDSYSTGSVSGTACVGGLVGVGLGAVTNSHYNIDMVLINGDHHVTVGGLYGDQYIDWFTHGKTLNIADYSSLLPNGGYYEISSAQGLKDLLGFADASGYKFRLTIDINLVDVKDASGATSDWHIPLFSATEFDGNGHTLSNLSINQPNNGIGFIGMMPSGSTLKSIGLTNINVTGSISVGGLVGRNLGTINNAYATGSISGDNSVGGLVGENRGTISNSYATGTVSGSFYVGGLVGFNHSCPSYYIGTVTNAYATGSVSGDSSVGGLVGQNTGNINNTYATGSVSGTEYIGGLVGDNGYYDSYLKTYYGSIISNSYATGSVSGTNYVGGLTGYNIETVSNSYWDTTTSGWATSAGGTGLTTAQMMTMSSFAGWDIANTGATSAVWRIYEGNTYPLLRSFLTPLTITADNVSKTYDGAAWSLSLQNVIYSIAGADTSGHLFNVNTPYGADNGKNADFYNPILYSDQLGYDISYVGGTLTINKAILSFTGTRIYDGTNVFKATTFGTGGTIITGIGNETVVLTGYGTVGSKYSFAGLQTLMGGETTLFITDGTGLAGNYTFVGGVQTATITPNWLLYLAYGGVIGGASGVAGGVMGYYLAPWLLNLLPEHIPELIETPLHIRPQLPSWRVLSYLTPNQVVDTYKGISVQVLKDWHTLTDEIPGSQGLIIVSIAKELTQPGSVFRFALPERMANEIAAHDYPVILTLADGSLLPPWLKYNPASKTFTATNVPNGALPITIMINFGGQSWNLEITT